MMETAPDQMKPSLDSGTRIKIERLVAFVDGVLESEELVGRHPLSNDIRNWAPWNLAVLSRLSDDLTTVAQSCKGFERVRRGLGKPNLYEDVALEVSLAAEWVRGDVQVAFTPEGKGRTPDLQLATERSRCHAEVTRLRMPSHEEWQLDWIGSPEWNIPEFEGLSVEIHFEKFISTPRRAEILAGLREVANRVQASGEAATYAIDGTMEAAISPRDRPDRFSMHIRGPSVSRDEVGRVAKVLRDKAAQLPEDDPGLVVVVDSGLVSMSLRAPDYSPLVADLEEYVFEHSRLGGVLLVMPFGAPGAAPFSTIGGRWAAWRRQGPSFLVEDRVWISNPYARHAVDETMLWALGYPQDAPGRRAGLSA